MIYPRFSADSFWVYTEACELAGAKYPTAPLGLITVAAMLPPRWEVRLVDRNTEALPPATSNGRNRVHRRHAVPAARPLKMVDMAHPRGKTVVVGGPDV